MRNRIAILLCLVLASCSPKIYERVSYIHDTTYISKIQVDSVFKRDSIFIKEKGDTVFIYKEKIREKYKLIYDTTYIAKHDTTLVEAIKEVKVEKPLTWWQKARISAFWWLLGGLLALLIYTFRKPILALLRKFIL